MIYIYIYIRVNLSTGLLHFKVKRPGAEDEIWFKDILLRLSKRTTDAIIFTKPERDGGLDRDNHRIYGI